MTRRPKTALFVLFVLASAALTDRPDAAFASSTAGPPTTLCHVSLTFSSTDQTHRSSGTWVVQPDCSLKEVQVTGAPGARPSGAFAPVPPPAP